MQRRGAALLVLACLLVVAGSLERAWTPAPPPDAGVQVTTGTAAFLSRDRPPTGSPAAPPEPASPVAPPEPEPEPAPPSPPGDPRRLSVPALDVDSEIDPVGVRPDGAMEIPADGGRIGWYRFGPAPGAASGSAVLAGHVDTRRAGPGALFRLAYLELGAEIVVTDADGHEVRYVVTGRETITKRALPVDRLFARDGPPRLVVITCGGPFLPETGSYRDNVVVTAEPPRSG